MAQRALEKTHITLESDAGTEFFGPTSKMGSSNLFLHGDDQEGDTTKGNAGVKNRRSLHII